MQTMWESEWVFLSFLPILPRRYFFSTLFDIVFYIRVFRVLFSLNQKHSLVVWSNRQDAYIVRIRDLGSSPGTASLPM